jgi:hypothetical protein
LGHLTTFSSYGQVAADRQAELIRRLAQRGESGTPNAEMINRMVQFFEDEKHTFE